MSLKRLQQLYALELYDDVVVLAAFLQNTFEKYPPTPSDCQQQYQALILHGRALYMTGEYRQAESVLSSALSLFKNIKKTSDEDVFYSETETLYYVHLCLVKLEKYSDALAILERAPLSQRPPKIAYALASLYKRLFIAKPAVKCYAEVIASCPFALASLNEMFTLDNSEKAVCSVVAEVVKKNKSLSCFSTDIRRELNVWFTALKHVFDNKLRPARDYLECLIQKQATIAHAPQVLFQAAMVHYNMGEFSKATDMFRRLHVAHPLNLIGMDVFASLLAAENHWSELERLAAQMVDSFPKARETYICMGYLCRSMGKLSRALSFAHMACEVSSPASVEAMLLKGLILLQSKKLKEAVYYLHEAMTRYPRRFELYEILTQCHLAQKDLTKARFIASSCIQNCGSTGRSLSLYAMVLMEDESSYEDAKNYLKRARHLSPRSNLPVMLLATLYEKTGMVNAAIDLLREQTQTCQATAEMFRLLGDLQMKADQVSAAADSYRSALNLKPNDVALTERLLSVKKPSPAAGATSSPDASFLLPSNIASSLEPASIDRFLLYSDSEQESMQFG